MRLGSLPTGSPDWVPIFRSSLGIAPSACATLTEGTGRISKKFVSFFRGFPFSIHLVNLSLPPVPGASDVYSDEMYAWGLAESKRAEKEKLDSEQVGMDEEVGSQGVGPEKATESPGMDVAMPLAPGGKEGGGLEDEGKDAVDQGGEDGK
jgi:hypothetical protein